MKTVNEVLIRGEMQAIYERASQIEDWACILPHYREVTLLKNGARERLARMRCVRDFKLFRFPCRWVAEQELEPEMHRIIYRHVKGVTKGMYVEWTLQPEGNAVRTRIFHELRYPVPVLGALFANWIIGPIFVHYIAGKTLATLKTLIESEGQR